MKTLICVAGMPYSKATLVFGSLIASLEPSGVTLLTVARSASGMQRANDTLLQARAFIDGPAIVTKVRVGSPVEEIIAEAREVPYDIIVVGSRLARGLMGSLLEPITKQVTRRAPSSVLVVKEDRPLLRSMVICTGGRRVSPAVVETGGRLAQAAKAEVRLLHVADPVPEMYAGLDEMDETLEELLQTDTPIARHLRWSAKTLAEYGVTAELSLHRGIAVNEILREAKETDCDLLVIGAQVESSSWLNDLLMSTVTPQVVDRAPCSVLVVRSKD